MTRIGLPYHRRSMQPVRRCRCRSRDRGRLTASARRSSVGRDLVSVQLGTPVVPSVDDHWCHQEPSRQGLGRLLVGGISNPLEVIEQITYLLFLRRLDDMQVWRRTRPLGSRSRWSTESSQREGRAGSLLRGHALVQVSALLPDEMFTVLDRHVFPFLRTLGGNGSTYAHHMKDARFTIPPSASCEGRRPHR